MRKINFAFKLILIAIAFCQCDQPTVNNSKNVTTKVPRKRTAPKSIGYHLEKSKEGLMKTGTDSQQNIILAVNRTDRKHLAQMGSIIVPNDVSGDLENYLPFPLSVPFIKDISKIIFFSYPTQSFGAYEMGELVYAGPVNMGRKNDPTPTGLYYTNWKAEKTTSTFNDEWDLLWNFNIENKLGIGWHQYDMTGYPASHSCLRLLEKDARYLYEWAEQWIVDDKNNVKAQGTPVIVFGSYAFGAPKPWLQLITDPHALDITTAAIQQTVEPFINDIIAQEKRRAGAVASGEK